MDFSACLKAATLWPPTFSLLSKCAISMDCKIVTWPPPIMLLAVFCNVFIAHAHIALMMTKQFTVLISTPDCCWEEALPSQCHSLVAQRPNI